MNVVTLAGTVARDAETRDLSSGKSLTTLRIETVNTWRDRSTGEQRIAKDYHTVVGFGQAATDMQGLRQGQPVVVQGSLKTRKFTDNSGAQRVVTEVNVGFDGKVMAFGAAPGSGPARQQPADAGELDEEIPF